MSQLEDRQAYYEYDPGQGGKWYQKTPPAPEPWFEEALIDLAGKTDRKPNLRVVWGGTEKSDITERPQLKYMRTRELTRGYNYTKTDGTIGFVTSMTLATDAKMPWEFHPVKDRVELGRLRWAIERYVPAHELEKLGRFKNLHAPSGEKVLRDFPREGVYDHYFWVQTADHKYRDLDKEVLMAIQAMWLYNINTSEAQKTLDDIERRQKQILVGAAEAKAVWAGMTK